MLAPGVNGVEEKVKKLQRKSKLLLIKNFVEIPADDKYTLKTEIRFVKNKKLPKY